MTELPPQYNPQDVEERRYQWWDAQGFFRADVKKGHAPYTIVIPPPNVTGILHMGHALNNTIQDILIRTKRMQGANALWIPGTDHAGIATQNVVERALAKEGKRRQDLGREGFIRRVWAWKEQYGNTILYQLKRLGSSCDWRRTRFTMDEGLSRAVTEVFVRLFEQGLIYRGNYIINWCPRCQTALADEEAPREATQGKLYHIRYPLQEPQPGGPSYIEVATTRPETMLGDTGVAVHPKDPRYQALIGQRVLLPLVNRLLPIFADEAVDREFGTGAVKVTPAHDPVDFQLGRKHGLDSLNVMTDDAKMVAVPKTYEGLDRFDCRSKLIVDLEQQGYLGAIEEHQHNVGHCYRCRTIVEPRLSPQWFVKMQPLAKPAIQAVKQGTVTFVPERWTKVYLNWMENIQDWCISRQIWWGHRLPVWYCDRCGLDAAVKTGLLRSSAKDRQPSGIIVSRTPPTQCPRCESTDLRQDEDVLDTWFSSWLWPFSTLGWPERTKDLAYFYPTAALVTAQEIIFFWVARMIMAGYVCMGKPPFARVYIHGTVRDMTGKKMSKSLGNIIDPLEIIKSYGTDALRYTLITSTAIGQDIFLSEERFAAGRNFANKLWNATRYVLSQPAATPKAGKAALSLPDRWILSRLQRTITRVTESLEAFLFNDAANALYDFLWHDVCDWYLELSKHVPENQRPATRQTLLTVLEAALRLLHPVMPFVTEELWQRLPPTVRGKGKAAPASIMVAPWPKASAKLLDPEAEASMERFKAVVTAIRTTRAELNVPHDRRPSIHLIAKPSKVRLFLDLNVLLQAMAQVGDITVAASGRRPKDAAAALVEGIEVFVPLAGLIDVQKELTRLKQQVEGLNRQLAQVDARLRDEQFTSKAPKDVIEQAKDRRTHVQESLKKLSEHLAVLQSM